MAIKILTTSRLAVKPTLSLFDGTNTLLKNVQGGEYIVSVGSYISDNGGYPYRNLPNILTPAQRNVYLENYHITHGTKVYLKVDSQDLKALFNASNQVNDNFVMIIAENIDNVNAIEVSIFPHDQATFINLLPTMGTNNPNFLHNCFMFERKFFDNDNGMFPDGFSSATAFEVVFILGKESVIVGVNDYVIVVNILKSEIPFILDDTPAGFGAKPPAIGTKLPPKTQS
jgi:hypothetical protein